MDRVRALAMAALEFRFKEKELYEVVMPLLDLSGNKTTLDLYLKADAMPRTLKDLFEDGSMSFRGVPFLLQFSQSDQDYFAKVVGAKVKLTSSQLLQAGEWLTELIQRTGKNLKTLLKEQGLLRHLAHSGMDPRTKADKFFDAIRRLRFPRYTAYLEKFETHRAEIIRDQKNLRLEPTEGFEEKGFELHARFKNHKDLDAILRKLSEKRSVLNSLFDVML